jgi:hypothetical protein
VIWNPGTPPLHGQLVVVSGQCRKVGKTALVVDLISALGEFEWTAVKITPHSDSGCPVNGPGCACLPHEHTFAIREETNPGTGDTGRFLAAGARRALWAQTKTGRFNDVLEPLATTLERDGYVLVESNAMVEFWRPDALLMVLDPANPDVKDSARNLLELAHAFVFRSPFTQAGSVGPAIAQVPEKPKFVQPLGQPLPKGVQILARQLLAASGHPNSCLKSGNPAAF